MATHDVSRRAFVKRAAYVAPVILSLAVAPSYAKHGSPKDKDKDKEDKPGQGAKEKPISIGPKNKD